MVFDMPHAIQPMAWGFAYPIHDSIQDNRLMHIGAYKLMAHTQAQAMPHSMGIYTTMIYTTLLYTLKFYIKELYYA